MHDLNVDLPNGILGAHAVLRDLQVKRPPSGATGPSKTQELSLMGEGSRVGRDGIGQRRRAVAIVHRRLSGRALNGGPGRHPAPSQRAPGDLRVLR